MAIRLLEWKTETIFATDLIIFRSTGKSQKDFHVSMACISWQKCLFGVGGYFIIEGEKLHF